MIREVRRLCGKKMVIFYACFMPYNLKLLKNIETGCEYELNHYI